MIIGDVMTRLWQILLLVIDLLENEYYNMNSSLVILFPLMTFDL